MYKFAWLKTERMYELLLTTGYSHLGSFVLIYVFPIMFIFNRCYSILSLGGAQQYNLEALPFTYGQYVVIELADKLYNSVTVCFCASRKYVFHIGCKWEPNAD